MNALSGPPEEGMEDPPVNHGNKPSRDNTATKEISSSSSSKRRKEYNRDPTQIVVAYSKLHALKCHSPNLTAEQCVAVEPGRKDVDWMNFKRGEHYPMAVVDPNDPTKPLSCTGLKMMMTLKLDQTGLGLGDNPQSVEFTQSAGSGNMFWFNAVDSIFAPGALTIAFRCTTTAANVSELVIKMAIKGDPADFGLFTRPAMKMRGGGGWGGKKQTKEDGRVQEVEAGRANRR
jgi:hypothetical protein